MIMVHARDSEKVVDDHDVVMLSAEASNAKTPLATRPRASDDLEVLGEALDELEDVIGVGVDVATAFTPPVTGPLSTTYHRKYAVDVLWSI